MAIEFSKNRPVLFWCVGEAFMLLNKVQSGVRMLVKSVNDLHALGS